MCVCLCVCVCVCLCVCVCVCVYVCPDNQIEEDLGRAWNGWRGFCRIPTRLDERGRVDGSTEGVDGWSVFSDTTALVNF